MVAAIGAVPVWNGRVRALPVWLCEAAVEHGGRASGMIATVASLTATAPLAVPDDVRVPPVMVHSAPDGTPCKIVPSTGVARR